MKLAMANRVNTIISGGNIGPQATFGMELNAKMVSLLSDVIYQDKIGSMVREITCNAMDAHIVAGTPNRPVTIHVPDSLEPWFSVKDEGIGMSPDVINAIYTMYGVSTKDDNNDTVGAFGLGSKVPFAYTDQFTVVSIFQGVKRVYIAVKNEHGLPVINPVAEILTDEHDGVEVNVSVNASDFYAFKNAIEQQLKFFKVKPILVNNRPGVTFPDLTQKVYKQTDGVTIYEANANILSGIWIVQGGVGYRLEASNLGKLQNVVEDFVDTIQRMGAMVEFDIGQIEVTASREGISYTAAVCKRIIDRLTDVAKLISDEAIIEIRACATVWERAIAYNKMIGIVRKAVRNHPDFDKLFEGSIPHRYGNNSMAIDVDGFTKLGYNAVYMEKYVSHGRRSYTSYTKLVRNTVNFSSEMYGSTALYPTAEVNVFVRDTKNKPLARMKAFTTDYNYPEILIIESANTVVFDDKDIAAIEKVLCMPAGLIKRLSDIEAPKIVRSSNGKAASARPVAYKFSKTSDRHSSREWEEVLDMDEVEGAVWVEMDRHTIQHSAETHLALEAARHGMLGRDIIAVNASTATKIRDGKLDVDLISAVDVVANIKPQVDRATSILRTLAKYETFVGRIGGEASSVLRPLLSDYVGTKSDKVHARINTLRARVKGWEWLRDRVNTDPSIVSGKTAADKFNSSFFAKYPLLKAIHPYKTIDMQDVVDYMEMMDKRG
jgi:hypothetical protein